MPSRLTSVFRLEVLLVGASLAVAACGASDAGTAAGGAGAASAGASGVGTAGGAGSSAAGASAAGTGGAAAAAGAADAGSSGGGAAGSSAGTGGAAGSSAASAGVGGSSAGSAGLAGSAQGGFGGSPSLPAHSGKWRITPLGDSITGTTCGPQLLSKALLEKGKTNFSFVGSNLNNQSCNGAPNVQTEGHGGYLVTDLVGNGQHASELPTWCSTDKADIVLMQFGTNDVWNNRTPASILDAYSTVLVDLRAANANVVLLVAQITPLNPQGCSDCEARAETLNSQIPGWAKSKSTTASPIVVVDIHSLFSASAYTPSSMYTADGVHPNVAGAQLIANKWLAALTALGAP